MNIESLLALAEEALYKAKSQGRNRHVHSGNYLPGIEVLAVLDQSVT